MLDYTPIRASRSRCACRLHNESRSTSGTKCRRRVGANRRRRWLVLRDATNTSLLRWVDRRHGRHGMFRQPRRLQLASSADSLGLVVSVSGRLLFASKQCDDESENDEIEQLEHCEDTATEQQAHVTTHVAYTRTAFGSSINPSTANHVKANLT